MKKSLDTALEVAKKFVYDVMPFYDEKGIIDRQQLSTSLQPYIANAMYAHGNELLQKERMETLITLAQTLAHGNELLQKERMETLITLARTLDNENIEKVVEALKFQITLKK